MGIDLLDLSFRIERDYGVEISAAEWESIWCRRIPPDVSAGEVADLIQSKKPTLRRCVRCDYDLRAHASAGRCPECGSDYDDWETLKLTLSEVTGVDVQEITRDSLFLKDLGFT